MAASTGAVGGPAALNFLEGDGDVARLMLQHDWARSPLGPPVSWPQSLKSVVGLLLTSKFPMFVAWGEQLGFLYNDAYALILGGKHPAALGARFRDIWGEIWPELTPLIAAALRGEAIYRENLPLTVNRLGFDEQAFFTFSYSPVRDEQGAVAGMFCAVAETTHQVFATTRQSFRLALEERLHDLDEPADIMAAAASALGHELKVNRVGYGDVSDNSSLISITRDWTDGSVPSLTGTHLLDDFGKPIIDQLRAGKPVVVDDVALDERLRDSAVMFRQVKLRSVLAVPMVKGGQLVAKLYLHHAEPRRWRQSDLRLVEEVADRTWAAVARARADSDRRASEIRFRALATAGSYALYRMSPDWAQLRQLDGKGFLTDTETPTSSWVEQYIDPLDHQRLRVAIDHAMLHRAVFELEHRVRRIDGTPGWALSRAVPIIDDDGRVTEWFGTAADITARKTDEARLRELNETLERRVVSALAERRLLASIVEGTDVMVQVVDLNFRWLGINRAAAREFAHIFASREPQPGDHVLALLEHTPEQREAVRAIWQRALNGDEFNQTARFGLPARQRDYDIRFRSLRDEQGALIGAYQFVTDVSDRVQEQKRLAQVEATLLQMQKMEAVGQLTGGIAHDFNNLLQGISGSLELIRRKPHEPGSVLKWAESGLRSAERGAKLTGQLLAFSRVQKIELKPLLVADIVESMRALLQRTLGPVVRVRLALDADGGPALADETQLEMAILNLAINARDAMPHGGDLTIGTRLRSFANDPELPDGPYVELFVSDTGTGMAPEVAARAFDPFFTTKGVGKGTGLGLSQVYGAIRQSGGAVRIESALGEGTTVRMFLQRTSGVVAGQAESHERPPAVSLASKVLVVDDDADVREFLTDSLRALGYQPMAAADGEAGLEAAAAFHPDAVILDFAMPGMSGAEVARLLRERQPKLPIIFASGFSDTSAIRASAGETATLLRKPFRVDELHRVLAGALGANAFATATTPAGPA